MLGKAGPQTAAKAGAGKTPPKATAQSPIKRKPPASDEQEPLAKKVLTGSELTGAALKDSRTYLKRCSTGFYKRLTDGQKAEAKRAQDYMESLQGADQVEFALAFQSNKTDKKFTWVKEFQDKLVSSTIKKITVIEKYMTRTIASTCTCISTTITAVIARHALTDFNIELHSHRERSKHTYIQTNTGTCIQTDMLTKLISYVCTQTHKC